MKYITAFILIAVLAFWPPNLYAANDLFTIENIEIDVSAENAIKAREKAFEEAQLKAFEELSTRMLSEGAKADFQSPPVSKISRLIQDFEVSNEKLSSTRYSGVYKIRFKDRDVKQLFAMQGSEVIDMISPAILILPFRERAGVTELWTPGNDWMRAWNKGDHDGGVVPIIVPIGDISDVQDMPDEDALTYNPRDLAAMLRRYNAKEAVIAIAKDRPEGGLAVQLYRTDRGRPEYAHFIQQPLMAGTDQAMLNMLAVGKVKAALREDWKNIAAVAPQQRGTGLITVRARFNGIEEWGTIRQALTRIIPVTEMEISALSPREAYLKLRYDGSLQRLQMAMAQSGMQLSAARQNQSLNNTPILGGFSSGADEAETETLYDLIFVRTRKPSQPGFVSNGTTPHTHYGQQYRQRPSGQSHYNAQF